MSILSKPAVPQKVLPDADRLAGTRVLIFGGASGIGFGIDNMALSNGATVVISGSQQAKIDEKVQLLKSLYPSISPDKVSGYAIDLLNSEKLESELHLMFETITSSGSNKVDHIALTAGDHHPIPKLADITMEKAMAGPESGSSRHCSSPNLSAWEHICHSHPTPHSPLRDGAGQQSLHLDGSCQLVAVDLAPLRVNIVKPGAIETEMLEGILAPLPAEAKESVKQNLNLLRAFGWPEDIAEAYGWITKDRFVTGTKIAVDGGQILPSH